MQFDRAVAASGRQVHRFAIGGHRFDVAFAGPALVPAIVPALQHLAVDVDDERAPSLTIHAWDTASTGVPFAIDADDRLAMTAWRRLGPSHEIVGTGTDGDPSVGPSVMHQPHEDIFGMLDDGVAVHWVADSAAVPFYERSAPMLHLLHWWLYRRGLFVVHGGAVGNATAGALLVGPSGAGKSTAATSCVGSRLGYVGDDYTVVTATPEPRALSLVCSAKLDRDHACRLSHALPAVANPDGVAADKALYFVGRHDVAHEVTLRALVLPCIVDTPRPRVVPLASGAPIFRAWAPNSILQLPGSGALALGVMRDLCQRVPAFRLDLGRDIEAVPDVLGELLAS